MLLMVGLECERVTHCNGTQGMWVGDSSEWNAWYVIHYANARVPTRG